MPTRSIKPDQTGNQLLDLLSSADRRKVIPYLKKTRLKLRAVFKESGETVPEVCFPIDSILSSVVRLRDGKEIEVANVGSEGMVSAGIYLGGENVVLRTFCQVEGDVLLWNAKDFIAECRKNSRLDGLIRLYIGYLMSAYAQSAACNRAHSIEQRCARWLLLGFDRAKREEFPLTHEFMAKMLGVRRATVTEVASSLQKKGLIGYRWGKIRILDRGGLESASCECYRSDIENYQRLVCQR
jgi:CRP-like cAMP-binding protein